VKKGSTITLTIAQKNSILLEASIIGMTEEKAKNYLNSRSIISTVITEYSDTVTPGCVIKTSPEVGSTVRIGSEVVLYIATDTQETVKMPDIQGTTKEMAEQALIAVGLEAGTVTEVNSEFEAGVVVQQSVEKDTEVPVGSKIDFTVSNGIPPESSVDVYVTLPSVNKTGILKIYLNSVLFYTSDELYLDGATKQFTLSGSGAENNYTITIDDSPVQKGKVDFTQDPAVITEVEEITFENKVVLVNVEGVKEQEAIEKLKNAGFKNVETVKQPSMTVPYGVVISQTPHADGVTKFSTNESITLNVSSGTPATY
jgi:beta-lactam-binding protein with PASTA domain